MTLSKWMIATAALTAIGLGPVNSAQAQTYSLSAVLLGGNECNSVAPPAGPVCRLGDANAFGRATITFPTATSICVTLQVDNLAGATAAHIHRGRETFNGGIVLALPPPAAPGAGNPGVSSFCGAIGAALQTAMRTNPAGFYVNVHNGAFPNGAMRGQLF